MPERTPISPHKRLWRLVVLERDAVQTIFIYALAIGLSSLAVPIAVQALVNTVAFGALLQPIIVLSLAVFGGLTIAAALRVMQHVVSERVQMRLMVRFATLAYERITRASADELRRWQPAKLSNRLNDVVVCQKSASKLFLDGIGLAIQVAAGMILLAFYHPWLLAFDGVLLVTMVVVVFTPLRGGSMSAIAESQHKHAAIAWIHDVVANRHAFRGATGRDLGRERLAAHLADYLRERRRHFRYVLGQSIGGHAIQVLSSAALLALGGALVISGQLTLGQLVAAEIVVGVVLVGLTKVGAHLENYYDLVAALDKLGDLTDLEPQASGPDAPVREGAMRLELRQVSWGDTAFDLAIEPSEVAALMGDVDGVARGLYGEEWPNEGHVIVDGRDLRSLEVDELVDQIQFVGSDDRVARTVDEFVRMGAVISSDTVEAAIASVGLSEDVRSLELGRQTRIDGAVCPLSRRQRVLLGFARAIAHEPRLLIVDRVLDLLSAADRDHALEAIQSMRVPPSVIIITAREEVARRASVTVRVRREEGAPLPHAPLRRSDARIEVSKEVRP